MFSVIISIFNTSGIFNFLANILSTLGLSKNLTIGFFSGILELTNGINNLSIIGTKNIFEILVICSFLLGFGGLSVAMQVYSCISKSDLSIKPYLIGKLLHGLLASLYTAIFLIIFKTY